MSRTNQHEPHEQPQQNEQTRRVEVPNATLWSVRRGLGPPLAMLHGGPGLADYMAPVAALVEDLAMVYRYDQRGCGRSAGGPPFDVATAIADLDAVRAAWDVPRWMVSGHSWGASLALAYAVAHPERTSALLYISGTGVDPAWHEAYRAARLARLTPDQRRRWQELRALAQAAPLDGAAPLDEALAREEAELRATADLGNPARAPQLVAWLRGSGVPPNQEVNRLLGQDAARTLEDPSFAARLKGLQVPTLVLHGALDPRPARFAAQVAQLIPNAQLAIMDHVAHWPRFEDPDSFARIVRAFLINHSIQHAG